jgi:hypothetical protein
MSWLQNRLKMKLLLAKKARKRLKRRRAKRKVRVIKIKMMIQKTSLKLVQAKSF